MSSTPVMKDGIGPAAIKRLAKSLKKAYPDFKERRFVNNVLGDIETLELKARVYHVISHLAQALPRDFKKTAKILQTLPDTWIDGDVNDSIKGFAAWPVIDYVGVYGLDEPKIALQTLEKITHLFSAEFAIRPLIEAHPILTFQTMMTWCDHSSEHVRRLASEGARPRLPWGLQLKPLIKDPSPLFPILEKLKTDDSEYVRRSVANCLNDISKDHPERMLNICKNWSKKKSLQKDTRVQWIIRHACRGLIKAGHPDVFPLLGYSSQPSLRKTSLEIQKPRISLGDDLLFSITLTAGDMSDSLVVDYAIHFVKANGKTAPKVFKLKSCTLNPGQTLTIEKKHTIKPITTRRYYSGKHKLALHINGKEHASRDFDLTVIDQ